MKVMALSAAHRLRARAATYTLDKYEPDALIGMDLTSQIVPATFAIARV
jgi:hypothetical protein